jgi:DNA invertase Pin-like site-specific DNA recombinase
LGSWQLADFERALIAEQVTAGMARAKAQGKHVCRPRIPAQKETAIRRDLQAGRRLRSTIREHISSRSTDGHPV